MFRRYKDPAILSPRFQPLYGRLGFFDGVRDTEEPVEELEQSAVELIEFVEALEMGSFYAKQLRRLLRRPSHAYVFSLGGGPDPESERARRRHNREYREQLMAAKESATALVIEQLRFQNWTGEANRR